MALVDSWPSGDEAGVTTPSMGVEDVMWSDASLRCLEAGVVGTRRLCEVASDSWLEVDNRLLASLLVVKTCRKQGCHERVDKVETHSFDAPVIVIEISISSTASCICDGPLTFSAIHHPHASRDIYVAPQCSSKVHTVLFPSAVGVQTAQVILKSATVNKN